MIQAIKSQKHYAIQFLLDLGADPHIMDLAGLDACDHAKKWGIASDYPQLAQCHPELRRQPTYPDEFDRIGQARAPQVERKDVISRAAKALPTDKYAIAYRQLSSQL